VIFLVLVHDFLVFLPDSMLVISVVWILMVHIHGWKLFLFLLGIILVSNEPLIFSSSAESTWIFFLSAGTNQICVKTSQLATFKLVPVTPSNPLKQRPAPNVTEKCFKKTLFEWVRCILSHERKSKQGSLLPRFYAHL